MTSTLPVTASTPCRPTPSHPVADPTECQRALHHRGGRPGRGTTTTRTPCETAEARRAGVGRIHILGRHLAGASAHGLNHFLDTFSLGTYDPRVHLSYTITGGYEIDNDDVDAAARRPLATSGPT
jgi:hypothetical protein